MASKIPPHYFSLLPTNSYHYHITSHQSLTFCQNLRGWWTTYYVSLHGLWWLYHNYHVASGEGKFDWLAQTASNDHLSKYPWVYGDGWLSRRPGLELHMAWMNGWMDLWIGNPHRPDGTEHPSRAQGERGIAWVSTGSTARACLGDG